MREDDGSQNITFRSYPALGEDEPLEDNAYLTTLQQSVTVAQSSALAVGWGCCDGAKGIS